MRSSGFLYLESQTKNILMQNIRPIYYVKYIKICCYLHITQQFGNASNYLTTILYNGVHRD